MKVSTLRIGRTIAQHEVQDAMILNVRHGAMETSAKMRVKGGEARVTKVLQASARSVKVRRHSTSH